MTFTLERGGGMNRVIHSVIRLLCVLHHFTRWFGQKLTSMTQLLASHKSLR